MTRMLLSDADERKMTMIAIEHIAEVDLRKLYLKLGFSSMYEYLRTEIGYSEGCTQRRIDAARLAQNNPELGEKIKCGSVNLTQISKAQQVFRQVKKETKRAVPLSLQKQILAKIENKSVHETELVLAQELNIKIETSEKRKIQKDESVRIELNFAKDEMAKRAIKSYERKACTSTTAVAVADSIEIVGEGAMKTMAPDRVTRSITPRVRREFDERL